MTAPRRGEIWWIDLNPTRGHEQSGRRPGLVISDDIFNAGPAELVVVLPLTTRDKKIPLHERIVPPEGGLADISYIKCEARISDQSPRRGCQPESARWRAEHCWLFRKKQKSC